MSLPLAPKGFVVKPLDDSQAGWAGNANNIFPFLVSLEDIDWKTLNSPADPTMLIHLPHTQNILYYI
jgi:hypothetical protein